MIEISGQFETALRRLGGDEQLFQELATYFIEDSGELLKTIRIGIAANTVESIERAAHGLRGLAANFDAEQVVSIATTIEDTWPPEANYKGCPRLFMTSRVRSAPYSKR